MNSSVLIGIVGVIVLGVLLFLLISQPFDCQHRYEVELKHKNDSLEIAVQGWRNSTNQALLELSICEAKQQVNTVPTTPTGDNSAAWNLVKSLREELDSVKRAEKESDLTGKLQPQLWSDDKVGYTLDNRFLNLKLFASGSFNPMTGMAVVQYTPTWFEMKEEAVREVTVEKLVYARWFYPYAEGGVKWSWTLKEFAPVGGVGLNLDFSEQWAIDIKALRAEYSQKKVVVKSEITGRLKL